MSNGGILIWDATCSSAAEDVDAAIFVGGRTETQSRLAPVAEGGRGKVAWRPGECGQGVRQLKWRTLSESIADASRALSWKMVDGAKGLMARLVVKSRQGLVLGGGSSDASPRVRLRASNLEVTSLGAFKESLPLRKLMPAFAK